jgi:site-specific DNA-methyltransferase (adenine-specific)
MKLLNGDCVDIVSTLPSMSVDAIITDIPYGTTKNKWDTIIPFSDLWKIVKHVLKPDGIFITTSSQPFSSALIMSNLKFFKYELIWDKGRGSGSLNAKIRPMKHHENILIFGKGVYNPQMTKGKMQKKASGGNTTNYNKSNTIRYENDIYYPTSILSFLACHNMTGKIHPAQKPVELYEYLVKTYSNENDLVLDICMGIGTTGMACKKQNRRFIGIEKEKKYFDLAVEKLSE